MPFAIMVMPTMASPPRPQIIDQAKLVIAAVRRIGAAVDHAGVAHPRAVCCIVPPESAVGVSGPGVEQAAIPRTNGALRARKTDATPKRTVMPMLR